jgi:hypothetical protein
MVNEIVVHYTTIHNSDEVLKLHQNGMPINEAIKYLKFSFVLMPDE